MATAAQRIVSSARHPVRAATRAGRRLQRERQFRRFAAAYPDLAQVITGVRRQNLTYLAKESLQDLAAAMIDLDRGGIEGSVIEAGTALGGSAIVLARAKSPPRHFRVYDAFDLIPPPGEHDGADVHGRYAAITSGRSRGLGEDEYYGYRDDLVGEVTGHLREFGVDLDGDNVRLVKGLFQDTLTVDYPVALAHLDCDWYDSVATCLTRIDAGMVPGGRFVIDDYDNYSGCRKAVDEFLAGRGDAYRPERHSRLHLVRV